MRSRHAGAGGEQEASEKLLEAATTLAGQPQAMQLRYMQTLTEVARDRSSIIVFPLPIDLIDSLRAALPKSDHDANKE